MKRTLFAMIIWGVLLVGVNPHPAGAGDSQFEYYTKTSADTLKAETGELGSKLRTVFNQDSVKVQQQKIDFSEYFSHLKKSVLYAAKLATYNEYTADLRFARDKEIFKGLPEDDRLSAKNDPPLDRKEFAQNKYGQMKKNIEEEIDTYNDLIELSLDTCETLTGNDLSGILDDRENRRKVLEYIKSDEYRSYQSKKQRLHKSWPDVERRISAQFVMWLPKPPSPEEPIIDPKIIGAI